MKRKDEWYEFIESNLPKDIQTHRFEKHYIKGALNLLYRIIILDPRYDNDLNIIIECNDIMLQEPISEIERLLIKYPSNIIGIRCKNKDTLLKLLREYKILVRSIGENGIVILDELKSIYDIAKNMGINPLHSIILDNRLNISQWYDIKEIVEPTLESYMRLFKMDNEILKATDLIQKHYNRDSVIVAVVDSDADGVTSGAIIKRYFKHYLNRDIIVFSNDRRYGNGINDHIVDELIDLDRVDLLITADHGSADEARYKRLREAYRGIDILVTDHHLLPPDGGPMSVNAFVNPMDKNSELPTYITGATVIYTVLVSHYNRYIKSNIKLLEDLLGYAAITVLSDQVRLDKPLNRFMVRYLFKIYDKLKDDIPFFNSLANKLGIEVLNQFELNRNIIPVINSGGRMGDSNKSLDWLMSSKEDSLEKCATMMNMNKDRRKIQKKLFREVEYLSMEDIIIGVLHHKEGNGVAGIIANMVGDNEKMPAFIFVYDEDRGIYSGSGRAICDNVSIKDIIELNRSAGNVLHGGGHRGAGGVAIPKDKMDSFIKIAKEYMSNIKCQMNLAIDITFNNDLRFVNENFYRLIEELSPYGMNFKPFTARVDNLTVDSIFSNDNFSNITFIDKNGIEVNGIMFTGISIEKGNIVDYIICELQKDMKGKLNLMIKDINYVY